MSGLNIQIPLPDDFAALADQIQEAAANIKNDLAEIKKLKDAPLSYSEPETAEILGCSVIYLERLRRGLGISFSRVAGKIRYTPEQIKDYLDSVQTVRARGAKK